MKKLLLLPLLFFTTTSVINTPLSIVEPILEYESEWSILTKAIILVESQGNPKALASDGAAGLFQMMPIYVDEVNRISRSSYTYDDRYVPEKAHEMFKIMQSHYNPSHSVKKAIKLHNPRAAVSYYDKIYHIMDTITPEIHITGFKIKSI